MKYEPQKPVKTDFNCNDSEYGKVVAIIVQIGKAGSVPLLHTFTGQLLITCLAALHSRSINMWNFSFSTQVAQ